jgi:4-amino-4-deoxy-L-arabinose transferase-like glycosyltransferase
MPKGVGHLGLTIGKQGCFSWIQVRRCCAVCLALAGLYDAGGRDASSIYCAKKIENNRCGGIVVRFGKGFWILMLLTAMTVFIHLGKMPLLDPDEPVYAETPKEMILLHDYISPRIYGQVWYDKPPLYYWLVAGSFKVFGVNEFAARFPSAALAVVCVAAVYMAASKLFNERVGLMSGLALASSLEYFYLGKAAVTDITLTFCLTACLLCFMEKRYYLFYIFSALATLAKGPIGFLFPGAIILIWLTVTRRFGELKHMKIPSGVVLWGVVALPWYLAMYHLHGAAFVNGFIGINNIVRFTTAEHAKTSAWYFFIPVLILGFFPWTALLIQSVRASLKTKGTEDYSNLVFLNSWAALIFVFFSISSTKLVTYILPVFPPLAILVGWYIDRLWQEYRQGGKTIAWQVGSTVLTLLLLGGIAFGIGKIPAIALGMKVFAAILLLMMALVWYFLYKKDVFKAAWSQAVGMMLVSIVLVTLLFPPIANQFSTKNIARSFLAKYDGHSPVYIIKFLHPGFTLYTNIYGKEINSAAEIKQVALAKQRAYLVLKEPEYQQLPAAEKDRLEILASEDNKVVLLKR